MNGVEDIKRHGPLPSGASPDVRPAHFFPRRPRRDRYPWIFVLFLPFTDTYSLVFSLLLSQDLPHGE